MFSAFSKAFAQLSDPKIMRLMLISVIMTIVVYLLLCAGFAWLMFSTTLFDMVPLWDTLIDWAAVVIVPLAALLMFPVVISSFIGFLLDQVVEAVEVKHYPGLPVPRSQSIREVLFSSLRLLALALVLNLLLLPFYLLFPLVGQIGFYVINGYLIGREYIEAVVLRRLTPHETKRVRVAHSTQILLCGVLTTVMLTIPFLNLIAPIIGVAAMTHLAHRFPNQPLRAGTLEVQG